MSLSQDGSWTGEMAQTWADAQRDVDGVLSELSGRSGREWTRLLRAAADSAIGDAEPTFDRALLHRLVTFNLSALRDLVPPMSAEEDERLERKGPSLGFSFE